MGTVHTGIHVTLTVTSGTTVPFQDTDWDYRWHQILAADPSVTDVYATINGAPMAFKSEYSILLDIPIYSCQVTSNGSIVLIGVKTPRQLFGN
jgi:hypothetical protein